MTASTRNKLTLPLLLVFSLTLPLLGQPAADAVSGIPAIFLFSGVHEDYHRVSDESDKVNFTKAAAVIRVAFRLGWRLAWAKQPPVRKSPDPETGNR